MAVNGSKKFGEAPLEQSTKRVDKEVSELVLPAQAQVPKDPEVKLAVVQQSQKELTKLKANTKDASDNLQQAIKDLESKCVLSAKLSQVCEILSDPQEWQDFSVHTIRSMASSLWMALLQVKIQSTSLSAETTQR